MCIIDILELCKSQTQLDKRERETEKKLYLEFCMSNLICCPANDVQVLGRALCGDEGDRCIFGEALFVPDPVTDL